MANDVRGKVWKLDTSGATVIWATRAKIRFIEWFNPTTIGHLMQLTDVNDRVIVDGRAEAANQTQIFDIGASGVGNYYNGLKMPTLQSGIVYVHID